jgi:hypothetical protein
VEGVEVADAVYAEDHGLAIENEPDDVGNTVWRVTSSDQQVTQRQ